MQSRVYNRLGHGKGTELSLRVASPTCLNFSVDKLLKGKRSKSDLSEFESLFH